MAKKKGFFMDWRGGTTVGVVVFGLATLTLFSIQNGGLKNLHGQDLVQLSQLDPAAGEHSPEVPEQTNSEYMKEHAKEDHSHHDHDHSEEIHKEEHADHDHSEESETDVKLNEYKEFSPEDYKDRPKVDNDGTYTPHLQGRLVQDNSLDALGADLKDGDTLEHEGKTYIKHGDHWHLDVEFVEDTDPPTDCGVYNEWVSYKVDEDAVKATGKKYRILSPGQAMTMDHNPERINVFINNDGYVLSVRCG